jgi:hypothetical protein
MAIWVDQINLADVFHSRALTFKQRRNIVVERIKASDWYRWNGADFRRTIAKLAKTRTPEAFDVVWNAVYDYADVDRVWIATF